MLKKKYTFLFALLVSVFLCVSVSALEPYTNDSTGYTAIFMDNANLIFSETDQEQIMAAMHDITRFGNVIFCTTADPHDSSAQAFAEATYDRDFKDESGAIFLIDLYNRTLYISSSGKIRKQLSSYMSETITDNIYTLASQEKYANCAISAFDQISQVLNGQRLASPMRMITNLFFAFMTAFLINYIFVKAKLKSKLPTFSSLISANSREQVIGKKDVITKVTRTKHSSGGSGGGHGGGGHSGGGGGGHSGGGHRF